MSATTQQGTNDVGARLDRSERIKDVVGLVARLFLGIVLIWAGAAKIGHPLPAGRSGLRDPP